MFTDAHIHIALNRCFTKKQWFEASDAKRMLWLKEVFAEYKSRGIMSLRDGGDNAFISLMARQVAKEEGITYKSPVFALYKSGCYGSFIGRPVSDLDEIKKELRALASYQPDHIKVILTGLVDFERYGEVGGTHFTRRELAYISDFAKDNDLPLMVHANGSEGVGLAIRAGISTLEHGYLISEAELQGMAEAGVIWVPTLAPLGNILKATDLRFEKDKEVIQKVFNGQLKNIEKAAEIGLSMALGSDAGAYLVEHGSGLMDEMAYFERIGCFSRSRIESMCSENGNKIVS